MKIEFSDEDFQFCNSIVQYKYSQEIASKLKVVNVTTESVFKFISDYKAIIINNENQK